MKNSWYKTVRYGMRSQPIQDLHDYLDVHLNLDDQLKRAKQAILEGAYNPRVPESVLQEKSLGITRRILIPNPIDAIVLQTAVDILSPKVLNRQPSKRSYYSRSHIFPRVDSFDGDPQYPWWVLWPLFQKEIWKFTKSHEYTVITDIADYFDSISLPLLRNVISSFGHFDQKFLDFTFFLLESFLYSPSYVPRRLVGLPQINFDAPRLLAHCFLFEADKLLSHETGDNYVRWMDDITFGSDSLHRAKEILGKLHQQIGEYGLRLNSRKTKILHEKDAVAYFQIKENARLNIIQNGISMNLNSSMVLKQRRKTLRKYFNRFIKFGKVGQWDKVYKRYINLFGKIEDDYLEGYACDILSNHPELRDVYFHYLLHLGFSPKRYKIIEDFLGNGHCIDDKSRFASCKLLVEWKIPANSDIKRKVTLLVSKQRVKSAIQFTSSLWVLAKYGGIRTLLKYIKDNQEIWTLSGWAGRQVAAVTPLLPTNMREDVISILSSNGLLQGLQVNSNIKAIERSVKLDAYWGNYLLYNPNPPYNYNIQKYIVLNILLKSSMPKIYRNQLWTRVMAIIDDPIYREKLTRLKP